MTIREFITSNRRELDSAIARALNCEVDELRHRNDDERRLWIENDEGLHAWARSEGVRI